ncbi:hypothetical protein AURDEDRAFT_116158 [Auricularia subglabra TFB-10046 SS5]|nr:hypothetical protein AURDEDRAFT_116158 [Auricularia subglabra TFB-10046 SS5]
MRWSATIPALLASALVSSVQAVPTFESGVGSAGLEFLRHEQPSELSDFEEFLAARALGKREKDCVNLRDNVKPKDCRAALSTNGFRGAFFYDDNKNSYVKKDTVLSRDAVVTEITDAETKGKGKFTCDHILELNILKSVINYDGGICDKAAEMEDQVEAKAKLDKIRKIVNRPQNLVFFKSSLENIKTKNTQQFQREPVLSTGSTDLTFIVMYNYLEKTLSKTQQTAKLLDDAIAAEFPGAKTGVATLWAEYIAFTKVKAAKARSDAQKDIDKKKKDAEEKAKQAAARKAACGGGEPAGDKPPSRPPSPGPAGAGKTRRALRSEYFISSLERRAASRRPAARGAAKSGPNAPPAPSCPLPKQPPKKVVPRKDMKTKPPAKKTPRPVRNKPKPRAVKPKKTVARPKNRPRRAAGKPKPKKKVTPRKKPKKVPKPPKKPRGKPRPRRRK